MPADTLPDVPKKPAHEILIAGMLLTLVAGVVAFAYVHQSVDRKSVNPAAVTSANSAAGRSPDGSESKRPETWETYQTRYVFRTRLQDIDQRFGRMFEEIDDLEKEETLYREGFQELLAMEGKGELVENPWVVRYCWENTRDMLPRPKSAADFRKKLKTLMIPVKAVLEEPTGAFPPTELYLHELREIERMVHEARIIYGNHRRLVDTLLAKSPPPSSDEPITVLDRVQRMDADDVLAKFGFVSTNADRGGEQTYLAVDSNHLQLSLRAALLDSQDGLGQQVESYRYLAGY